MTDDRVIKTYVWRDGECFFVSTIERDSSALEYPMRYNETMAWEFNWEKQVRGKPIFQGEDSAGSIRKHLEVVKALRDGVLSEVSS